MTRRTREYPTEWTWYGADDENARDEQQREAPLDLMHQTQEGPIRLVVRAEREGWSASFVGRQVEGGRNFDTMADANEYVLAAFRLMFPDHRCDERCSYGRRPRRS